MRFEDRPSQPITLEVKAHYLKRNLVQFLNFTLPSLTKDVLRRHRYLHDSLPSSKVTSFVSHKYDLFPFRIQNAQLLDYTIIDPVTTNSGSKAAVRWHIEIEVLLDQPNRTATDGTLTLSQLDVVSELIQAFAHQTLKMATLKAHQPISDNPHDWRPLHTLKFEFKPTKEFYQSWD